MVHPAGGKTMGCAEECRRKEAGGTSVSHTTGVHTTTQPPLASRMPTYPKKPAVSSGIAGPVDGELSTAI
jgi:hypothetical protein